ncbi:MAG TPA: hypothetical protein VIH61_02310 [Waddliaceae bacterium]
MIAFHRLVIQTKILPMELSEKIRKIEALIASTRNEGERQAAQFAMP